MAYEKYTWVDGELITAEKLNHMEQGIEDAYELPAVTETDNGKVLGVENGAWSVVNGGGGGVLVVNVNKVVEEGENPYLILDKTWQEIYDAFMSTGVVFLSSDGSGNTEYIPPSKIITGEEGGYPYYGVVIAGSNELNDLLGFIADSPTDYPKCDTPR